MNTKKLTTNLIALAIVSVMLIGSALVIIKFGNKKHIDAESTYIAEESLQKISASYTSDKKRNDIFNGYKDYITTAYAEESSTELICDEEILNLVPEELFKEKIKDFLYIGSYYGFYINYDISDSTFFIYLFKMNIDTDVSGKFNQRISPYYYNKYIYDEGIGAVSVDYHVNGDKYYYHRYYEENKVAIQNIAFQGRILNTNELNPYERGYTASEDRGAYFIGGNFKFNGVDNGRSSRDIYADIKFFIGFGEGSETKINIADTLEYIKTLEPKHEYRDKLQNHQNYRFALGEIEDVAQIEKYGNRLRDYLSYIAEYPGKVSPRFLPQHDGYAENTYFYTYLDNKDKANCNLSTKIKLDIIEVGAGKNFTYITRDKESNQYEHELYNGNRLELKDNITMYARNIPLSRRPLTFTAPESGIYTIETTGSVRNAFEEYGSATVTDKEDGINQILTVDMAEGETFDFMTRNLTDEVARYGVKVTFTPMAVKLREKIAFTLAPGEKKFISYIARGNEIIEYSVSSNGDYFTSHVSYGTLRNYVNLPEITGSLTSAIKITNSGRYIVGVWNNGISTDNFELTLNAPYAVTAGNASSISMYKGRALIFTPQQSSRYNIGVSGSGDYSYSIYDSELRTLYKASGNGSGTNAVNLVKGDKYYIVIKRDADDAMQFTVTADIAPQTIRVGDTRVSKPFNEVICLFVPTTSAQYIFTATNCAIEVHDGETTLPKAAVYELMGGKRYYISVKGRTSNTITLNVSFVSTTSTIGTIPSMTDFTS